MIIKFLFVFMLCSAPLLAQGIINKIEFVGNYKTNEMFLHDYLSISPGDNFDSLIVQDNEKALLKLRLFSEVKCEINKDKENYNIKFLVDEVRSLLPNINFGTSKMNSWFQLGLTENNFLGSAATLGGYYKYYQKHSIEVYYKNPYQFNYNNGIKIRAARFSTLEPVSFNSMTDEFEVNKYSIELFYVHDFTTFNSNKTKIIVESGFEHLWESYKKTNKQSMTILPYYTRFNKLLFKSVLRIKNVEYYFEEQSGFENNLFVDVVSDNGDGMSFYKVWNEFKFYTPITKNNSFAGRIIFGLSTNKQTPFLPFVIDNYTNVRGSGDRVKRGSGELTVNLESRFYPFRYNWGSIGIIGFTDISFLRAAGEKFQNSISYNKGFYFAGAGLRFNLFHFYDAIFRIDYGFDLKGNSGGLVMGFNHYF